MKLHTGTVTFFSLPKIHQLFNLSSSRNSSDIYFLKIPFPSTKKTFTKTTMNSQIFLIITLVSIIQLTRTSPLNINNAPPAPVFDKSKLSAPFLPTPAPAMSPAKTISEKELPMVSSSVTVTTLNMSKTPEVSPADKTLGNQNAATKSDEDMTSKTPEVKAAIQTTSEKELPMVSSSSSVTTLNMSKTPEVSPADKTLGNQNAATKSDEDMTSKTPEVKAAIQTTSEKELPMVSSSSSVTTLNMSKTPEVSPADKTLGNQNAATKSDEDMDTAHTLIVPIILPIGGFGFGGGIGGYGR